MDLWCPARSSEVLFEVGAMRGRYEHLTCLDSKKLKPMQAHSFASITLSVCLVCFLLNPRNAQCVVDKQLAQETTEDAVKHLSVHVVAKYPHDSGSFTEGLEYYNGFLYESAGKFGHSSIRKVHIRNGSVALQTNLPNHLFAEGITRVQDRWLQMTYRAGKTFAYDLDLQQQQQTFSYREGTGEGWGLCYDSINNRLIQSDGSSFLLFRNPQNFEFSSHCQVTAAGKPLQRINELDCGDGFVWANVWFNDVFVQINTTSCKVMRIVDASGLLSSDEAKHANVLNGVTSFPEEGSCAADNQNQFGRFLITGKYWPYTFEVYFVEDESRYDPHCLAGETGSLQTVSSVATVNTTMTSTLSMSIDPKEERRIPIVNLHTEYFEPWIFLIITLGNIMVAGAFATNVYILVQAQRQPYDFSDEEPEE